MAPPPTMQREAIRLAAAILVAVLALRLCLLWRAPGDEGRQAAIVALVGLRRARLLLVIALLAGLIIVALNEGLRILRQVGLLARAVRLLKRPAVLLALLELLIGARLELLIVATLGAWLEIRVLLAELLLRSRDQTEIMFGVLKIILRRDRIAGRLRIACKLKIFVRHVIGGSANLDVRTVRFINPGQGILIAPVMVLLVIAPAHTLVVMLLTVSHGLLFNDS